MHFSREYIYMLLNELNTFQAYYPWGTFTSVYFGGGTPSLICPDLLQVIMDTLNKCYSISREAEITLECNPGTLTLNKLKAYKEAGINRLSIGLQSFSNSILKRIGRTHTSAQFLDAYSLARDAGFLNISIDLMHGLPGQTQKEYLDTLIKTISLKPEHISSYMLTLAEGTPLYGDVMASKETLPNEDEISDMQDSGISLLEESGYARYEISNFAKPGFCCSHNQNYWENGMYLGFGAAAHSAWRINSCSGSKWVRWSNPSDIGAYICTAKAPISERTFEIIPTAEEMLETIMLGLRQVCGIPLNSFEERFNTQVTNAFPKAVEKLTALGLLEIESGFIRLTQRGLDLQNTALLYFMDEQ